jgi:hypothetical protein
MTSGRKNSTVNSMFYNFCLILGVFIAPALSFFVIYSICSFFIYIVKSIVVLLIYVMPDAPRD